MSAPPPNPPQLSEANLRELQTAKKSLKKIRRAVSTARLEGYSVAICGALTLLTSGGNIPSMLGGTVLTIIGIIEITGASRLSRLDPTAARILTINQLTLAVLILLYALWNMYTESTHPASADLPGLSASDTQMFGDIGALSHEITMLMYGGMIAAAVVEAGMARYYHSRGNYLKLYLAETPPWIIAMQRTGVMS